MSSKIKLEGELQDIEKRETDYLVREGIKTLKDLEHVDILYLNKVTGISETKLSRWQAVARLRGVPGINSELSHLLVSKGVRDPWEFFDYRLKAITKSKSEEKMIRKAQKAVALHLANEAILKVLMHRPREIQDALRKIEPKAFPRIQQIALILAEEKITSSHLQVLKKHIFKNLDIDEATPEKIKKRLRSMSTKEIVELQKELNAVKVKEGPQ